MNQSLITVKKRLIIALAVIAFFFVVMLGFLFFRQIIQGKWLQEKANSQWTSELPIAAKRGKILDRNGEVLSQSAGAKTIILRPNAIKEKDKVADELSRILEMDRATVYEKATDTTKSEVWLKRQVEQDAVNEILSFNFEGVHFTEDTKRYYPMKTLASQVIGFVSVDGVGQSGLELAYNSKLAGKNGKIIAETDKNGVEIPSSVQRYIEAENGLDIVTTLDSVIQSFAEEAAQQCLEEMGAKSVQCIAMDPKTGEILAMVNAPGFDLNSPPRDDMALLNQLSRNMTILNVYEPGSTFKIITTAAALDSGVANVNSTYYCPGYRIVDGVKIKCWRTTPHGSQTLIKGVCNSCNPVFMTLAEQMGKSTFYEYIKKFGFGSYTGIDFNSDEMGIVTDQKYVMNADLARISFGQSIAVTPLQLITAASAAINGGNLMKPYLVKEMRATGEDGSVTKEVIEPTIVRRVISEETSATMRTILQEVVTSGGGKNAYIPGYRVGGKTGTAQKYENGVILHDKHISSFIGFAPADDPQIIVLFVVDEANVAVDFGSVVAAPYAKIILEKSLKYLGVKPVFAPGEEDEYNKKVEVPSVTGLSLDEAVSKLEEKGFYVLTSGTGGEILSQSPSGGEEAQKGSAVCIVASQQDTELDSVVAIPNIVGLTVEEAQAKLTEAGLNMLAVGEGKAKFASPQVGEKVPVGTYIIVEFH